MVPKVMVFISAVILLFHSVYAQENGGVRVTQREGDTENRVALVIGNGAYKNSPLRNPTNDARDMSAALTDKGFQVIQLLNADRRGMIDGIRRFGNELKKGGVGLFYYAGHGMQVNGRNYLIPVKATIDIENDIPLESVDVNRVLGYMDQAGNELNVVILDACRDNPFARSFRSTAKGLAQMDAPTGTLIAYATSPGDTAADGIGRYGVYTQYLLAQMGAPGLEIGQMFRLVRKAVRTETGGRQVPWESTSLEGTFYFSESASKSVRHTPVDVLQPAALRQPDRDSGPQLYKIVNTVDSRNVRIPHSFILDPVKCEMTVNEPQVGEWAVVRNITRQCEPSRGFEFRSISKNGYWADYDLAFSYGIVAHGRWKDSLSNHGRIDGCPIDHNRYAEAAYELVHTFENKPTLTPGTFRVDPTACKVFAEENAPDNEWRIIKIVTSACDPARKLSFRTHHKNGYWIDYQWSFTRGPIVTGKWRDSNGDTGTTSGVHQSKSE